MGWIKETCKAAPLAIVLPVTLWAASVKPTDAISNLALWAEKIGLHDLPASVKNPRFDQIALIAVAVISLFYCVLIWIRPRLTEGRDEVKIRAFSVKDVQGGRALSIARIGIKNNRRTHLSNCKVHVERIAPLPPLASGLPILLAGSDLTLRNDDPEKLVDIATHWEHVDKFRFHATYGGGFAETLNYIDDKDRMTIVIKLSSTEVKIMFILELWTDANRSLHIKYIGPVD